MGTWGTLQIFIISSLAYSLQSQILFLRTANLSTSWTNNLSTTVGYHQIILFNENPDAGYGFGYACGFYSHEEDKDSFFFAIGFAEILIDFTSGKQTASINNTVWLANRNRPVGKNATLQLLSDGNLVLNDAGGALVWSTNTSNKSVVGMELRTGNLVLYDLNNKTVWQSFDHPTDTLLPQQKLKPRQSLIASVSESNMSEGSFSFTVSSHGLSAFYQANSPLRYFTHTYINRRELTWSFEDFVSQFRPDLFFNSTISYMKLDPDGHIIIGDFKDSVQPLDLLEYYLNACDYPNSCGNFGLCSNGSCLCPAGFVSDKGSKSHGKSGCSQINRITCENTSSHILLPYEDVYYLSSEGAMLKGTDMESCKQACLRNCSCTVALFHYNNSFSVGDCLFPSPVLSLINGKTQKFDYQSQAFIKLYNEPGKEKGSNASPIANPTSSPTSTSIRTVIIAGSAVGAFFVLCLIPCCVLTAVQRNIDAGEGMEDDLDELSGMPIRFTYEELKVATEDFQKRLGGGGFGSVFEGSFPTGEKIAVKRLDALGQGKKEFLAEVNTIGNINHNYLVRLIGFCAENFHRMLVYEFMCNGSLDKWIFVKESLQPPLEWRARKAIIQDIAKGLAYLHEDCRQIIVHLDIKPQNILLDLDMCAKISDFGLSKLIDRDQSQVVTTMRGTPGYLAPEWFNSVITEKADVYSFGIVVMETVCGRKNLDRLQPEELMHLLPIFMKRAEEGQLIDMVDKSSEDMELHKSEVVDMMRVAIWCLQSDYTKRPSMSVVVKVLEGTMDVAADLDYNIQNPTTISAIKKHELRTSAPLLPSILSGPR